MKPQGENNLIDELFDKNIQDKTNNIEMEKSSYESNNENEKKR